MKFVIVSAVVGVETVVVVVKGKWYEVVMVVTVRDCDGGDGIEVVGLVLISIWYGNCGGGEEVWS